MSEGIIEVLMNPLNDENSAYFTVNTAVASVELTVPANNDQGKLATHDGRNVFQYGENYIVLSYGCVMPMGFSFIWQNQQEEPGIEFWINKAGTLITDNWERLPSIYLPFEQYETSLGMYFPGSGYVDPVIDGDFELRAKFRDKSGSSALGWFPKVSMLNVPAALDTEKFYVPIFIKVLHTYALYAIPE